MHECFGIDLWLQGDRGELARTLRVPFHMSLLLIGYTEATNLNPLEYETCCLHSAFAFQSLQFDREQMAALTQMNEALKQQVEEMQQEAKT